MTTEQTIHDLEDARREAMLAADVDRLDALLSEDLQWIHATARVDSKEGLLTSIGSGSTKYLTLSAREQSVRMAGSVALITGVMSMTLEVKGVLKEMENRFTIVWAPYEDTYRAVNWQSTPTGGAKP